MKLLLNHYRRATSLDDLQWVFKMGADEGWTLRAMDANSYFTIGIMQDFFIGELDGERISFVSIVRHSKTLAFVGFYFTQRPFRGKGYGMKTWRAAFEDVGTDIEFRLYSGANVKDVYVKSGFQPGWIVRHYAFTCDRAAETLSECQLSPAVAKILPGGQVNFEKLVAYGADMTVSSQVCKFLLAAWLSNAQESSWVALGKEGEVLGYLIMSETVLFPERGYRIAPFFADSAPIARSLLKMAVEYATPNNPKCLSLQIPPEFNIEAVNIVDKELGGKPLFDMVFMGTEQIPKLALHKVFGFASPEIM